MGPMAFHITATRAVRVDVNELAAAQCAYEAALPALPALRECRSSLGLPAEVLAMIEKELVKSHNDPRNWKNEIAGAWREDLILDNGLWGIFHGYEDFPNPVADMVCPQCQYGTCRTCSSIVFDSHNLNRVTDVTWLHAFDEVAKKHYGHSDCDEICNNAENTALNLYCAHDLSLQAALASFGLKTVRQSIYRRRDERVFRTYPIPEEAKLIESDCSDGRWAFAIAPTLCHEDDLVEESIVRKRLARLADELSLRLRDPVSGKEMTFMRDVKARFMVLSTLDIY